MDVHAMLKQHHHRLRGWLDELREVAERRGNLRSDLLEDLRETFELHSRLELDVYYPAFRDAAETDDDRQLVDEARGEHELLSRAFDDLVGLDASTNEFAQHATSIADQLGGHLDEEEAVLFPRAEELLAPAELESIGRECEILEDDLLSTLV